MFGFTEYNRHKDCSPYIPSVMIDKERFLVFIYNPVVDSLFFTGFVPYFEPDFQPDKFEPTGIIFLWIVLNHRLFFRKGLPVTYQIPCGFKRSCGVKTLGHYQNLDQYKVCVTTRTAPNLMRDWTWPMFLPPDLGETEGWETNKIKCVHVKDSEQPGHPPSLISLWCLLEETKGPSLPIEPTAKIWENAQADLSIWWVKSKRMKIFSSGEGRNLWW